MESYLAQLLENSYLFAVDFVCYRANVVYALVLQRRDWLGMIDNRVWMTARLDNESV